MLTQTNQSNQMTESTSKSSTRCDECSNDKSIRSISLADSIQFEFEGNSSKHSIVLGDCDNDGVGILHPLPRINNHILLNFS